MQNFDELRVAVASLLTALIEIVVRVVETVDLDLTDLDQRLQAVEKILRDPILAAQCLPGLGLVSAPLTSESPAPSGAPSDPGTRSGSLLDSC